MCSSDLLDAQVGKGNWSFALSADHGVGHSPQWLKERSQKGGRALLHTYAKAAAEKALKERFAAAVSDPKDAGNYVIQAAEYSLELDAERIIAASAKLGQSDRNAALLEATRAAAQAVEKVPGMLRAFVTSDVLAQGLVDEPIQRAMFYAAHPDQIGRAHV